MKPPLWIFVFLAVVLGSALEAQSGGPYDLSWSKISGGGKTFSTGGNFSLGSTTGQQDAGVLAGGNFTLNGGFWGALAPGCGTTAPVITAPLWVPINATGVAASVPNVGGATYAWTLTGGTITSGQGTSQILLDAGAPGTTMQLSVTESVGACTLPPASRRIQVDFLDVPPANVFHDYVDTLARNGVTGGCGGGNYCPSNPVRRDQMAVFLLKAEHGSSYAPPACTGVFPDVPCPGQFTNWVEELYAEGITGGCGGGNYCPLNAVRRDQMAVFLLKAEHGSGYVPPPCTGIFLDVPCPSTFADWIERLAAEQVTGGCGGGNYCPLHSSTRGQMAVFLVKTFQLQ